MLLGCFMSEEIGRLGGPKNIRDAHLAAREPADRTSQEIYEFGPFRLEPAERKLSRDGSVVTLTPKGFDMLVMLVRNSNHLLDKDELIRSLWPDSFVEEGNLSNNVFWLRKALGNDHEYIETVPRRGYRFVGAVRQLPIAERPPSELFEFQNADPAHPSPAGPVTVVVPSAAAKMGSAAPSRRSAIRTRWALVWLIVGIAVILLASGYWYLTRSLPAPRITAYTQITHDGREKALGGTDGSRLYFTQSSPNSIAQVAINGGEIAQLSIPLHAAQISLWDISPDGSNALVRTFEEGHGGTLYVAPILGGSARRLGDGEAGNFSPDGNSVIYSDRNGDLFRVHIDGSDKHKLASAGTVAYLFRWSPDGKVIRFSKRDGLWEMSSDGTGIHRQLPGWKGGAPCCGEWTREGGTFLFLAGHQIWALDERRSLFRRPSPVPVQLTSGPILWARALPGRDGKTLFTHGFTPRGDLSLIDAKTGTPNLSWMGFPQNLSRSPPMGALWLTWRFPRALSGKPIATEATVCSSRSRPTMPQTRDGLRTRRKSCTWRRLSTVTLSSVASQQWTEHGCGSCPKRREICMTRTGHPMGRRFSSATARSLHPKSKTFASSTFTRGK